MNRLEEMKKKFCILDDWTITMGSDQGLDETPYTGQCNINLSKHIAIIYPWHTNELEPSDYILHEILHIAIQALLLDYDYRELFVQDLCIQFKEKDQEVARLENDVKLHVAAEDKGWNLYNDSLIVIERLRKEKEWLINQLAYVCRKDGELIIEEMQQVLKDGK